MGMCSMRAAFAGSSRKIVVACELKDFMGLVLVVSVRNEPQG